MSVAPAEARRAAAAPGFTGERVVEGETPGRIWDDHQARYEFSVPLAVGRRVLDAACGTGYGSLRLARHGAREVLGVDIDAGAVAFARERYAARNLSFLEGDVAKLPVPEASFDVVTSFETIEHVPDAEAALAELTRVLVPNGVLLISTPNRIVTSPTKKRSDPPDNPYHRVEYTQDEFDAFLAPRYRVLGRYGQRSVPGLLYHPRVVPLGRKLMPYGYAPKHGSSLPAPLAPGWQARYLLYVCQRS